MRPKAQALFDSACQAVAWVLMEPARNKMLAEMAVAETGLARSKTKLEKS